MNLYLRYFNKETLVNNADDAILFLHSIPEIDLSSDLEVDIREYASSNVLYPKRYKVRPRVYFIVIKTYAETMTDFKQKKALRSNFMEENGFDRQDQVSSAMSKLVEERPGWYEGTLDFKRVVMIPATGKFEYRDTKFVVQCKANSGQECYDKIVSHLKERVDSRSQFPAAKGKNFHYKYLGMWK